MTCLLHPHTEAAASCEYCSQPHCAACLQALLGRRYCPDCLARVSAIAYGKPTQPPHLNGTASHRSSAGPRQTEIRRAGPAMPGWASVLLYLIGFYFLEMVSGTILTVSLAAAQALYQPEMIAHRPIAEDITDAAAVGLPVWVTIFAFSGWATLLIVLAYTALASHLVERQRLPDLGLRWNRSVLREILVGLGLAVILFVSAVGVGTALGWYRLAPPASWSQALLTAGLGFLILLPFAAVEEVSIRGYVLRAGSRSWGSVGGLFFSAVVFAGLHSLNPHIKEYPLGILGLVLAGLYLGLTVRITGNLWLAIFLHTGWNLMEGPIFGLPVSGLQAPASVFQTTTTGPSLWTGGPFGPEAGVLLCVMMGIHITALWCLSPLLRAEPTAAAADSNPAPAEPQAYRAIPLS